MVTDNPFTKLFESVKRTANSSKRWPVSVYRLQFNSSFAFQDAARLVPYLHELGVTDCYVSPYFKARAGSLHGYDISDHNALNPEIGSDKDYQDFVGQLQKHGMGQILDIVPNHMAIFDNPKWQDVLENGPSSTYARFFDIDWEPIKAELHQKVLLPILEDLYGNVLESGQITLQFAQGFFFIDYRSHRLPVGPKTVVIVLEPGLERLREHLTETHQDFLELQSIITACKNLPERSETAPERVAERYREKEIIKRRLAELCARNKTIKATIDEVVKSFNGVAGDTASFGKLHDLLEKQAYRLSYWRVAAEEINYRRFFDVNELVALRMEDPVVFEETHRLVRDLLAKGMVTGLRVDHVDGLFEPSGYLWRLQEARWLDLASVQPKQDPRLSQIDNSILGKQLQARFKGERQNDPNSDGIRPLFLVVEKILGEKESLDETWPVDGTTGYEFAVALNQVFVNRRHGRAFLDVYRWFTHSEESFQDMAYRSKNLVMRTSMSAEVNVLAHQLDRVSERSWQTRDFTLNSLRDAIQEVVACFPVYRTYANAYRDSVDERDLAIINSAVSAAKRRNPAMSSAVFDFVKSALLLQYSAGMDEAGRDEQRLFVMHFQQFTGPVMAKGVEDTAFYIYNPLVSLNDIGGNPQRMGAPVEEFHQQNMRRLHSKPYSFVTTSTHDSKRGEDVRSRINVLSEIPGEWKSALARWYRLNRAKKGSVNGDPAPDRNEEYLLYQTLLGTFPAKGLNKAQLTEYSNRIQSYMLKALREAKVHTSWISPNASYEEAVTRFVAAVLQPSPSNQFLADFKVLNSMVAACGVYNSLSQVVLKIFSPGVPDIYQGDELLAFNLTDPDNRRPVDFERCRTLLNDLKKEVATSRDLAQFAKTLLRDRHEGRPKLYVVWQSLNYRKGNSMLFSQGEYVPLNAGGTKKTHVCVFAWQKGNQQLVVAAPRLVAGLTGATSRAPIGDEVWGGTYLLLPLNETRRRAYRNIFTGETISVQGQGGAGLRLADVFRTFPVAVLESVAASSNPS
ncbi:MAG: malto-oligosyltrehalose synthase [Chloroflexi bacterium]|nr:malto-oligosyltrehalose synthase [Chloroflexota bacterium]